MAEPFAVQRWSHAIRRRRVLQLSLGALLTATLVFAGVFRQSALANIRACEDLGYRIGNPTTTNVGVTTNTLDSLPIQLFVQTIEYEAQTGTIVARRLTRAQRSACRRFLDIEIDVSRTEDRATGEVLFSAQVVDRSTRQTYTVQTAQSAESCGLPRFLALMTLQKLDRWRGTLWTDTELPAPRSCQPYLENLQGFAAAKQDDYETAVAHYRNAIALSNAEQHPFAIAYGNLGAALLKLGHNAEAKAELATAVDLSHHQYPPHLLEHARACYRTGDYACSVKENLAVISLEYSTDYTALAYNNLSVTYRAQGNYSEALEALDLADVQLQSSATVDAALSMALVKNRGITQYLAGDIPAARRSLESALNAGKTFTEEISYYLILIDIEDRRDSICASLARYRSLPESRLFQERERRHHADVLWVGQKCVHSQ